jgi:hypothetical protein
MWSWTKRWHCQKPAAPSVGFGRRTCDRLHVEENWLVGQFQAIAGQFGPGGFGQLKRAALHRCVGQARLIVFIYSKYFPIFKHFITCKIWKGYFQGSKNFQTWQADRSIQLGHVSFLSQLPILSEFWIINSRINSNLKLVWILKGFKLLGKIL